MLDKSHIAIGSEIITNKQIKSKRLNHIKYLIGSDHKLYYTIYFLQQIQGPDLQECIKAVKYKKIKNYMVSENIYKRFC